MYEAVQAIVDQETLLKIKHDFSSVVEIKDVGKAVVFMAKKGGKVVVDPELVDEYYVKQGREKNPLEFDYYVIFDDKFTSKIEATRNFVEDGESWDVNGVPEKYSGRIEIAENSDELETALVEQSVLANAPGAYENGEIQWEYSGHAATACELVANQIEDMSFDHIVRVLRAGEFAHQSMESSLVNIAKSHDIEAKRVPTKLGQLTVGYIDDREVLSSGILDESRVLVTELCAASGVTALGLGAINKALGTVPSELQLVAPVVSQRGAQLILDAFPYTTIQAGPELVRLMNDHYYLVLHEESDMWIKVTKRLIELGHPIPEEVQWLGDGGDLTNKARLAAKNN